MRTLLENGLPAEGFVFDTALAAYLLDATAGSYDLAPAVRRLFQRGAAKGPGYLEPDAFSPLGDAAAAEASLRQPRRRRGRPVRAPWPQDCAELGLTDLLHDGRSCPCARCWRRWRPPAAGWTPRPWRLLGMLLAARGAPSWNSRSTPWRGRNSTSTPPSSWGRSSSASWACPTAKRPRPAGPPTPMCWKSSGTRHPIVGAVLEYRQYAKLKSTYADGLLKAMDPDGRVRTSFQMTVTATGPPLLHRAQSPEHPHPHGPGQRDPADVHRRRRAASWWTPTTPRSSCGCWPTWPGTRP